MKKQTQTRASEASGSTKKPDYATHLAQLRERYVNQTPWQRSGAGWQRLTIHNSPPNVLVTAVSAVEGLARALVVQQREGTAKASRLPGTRAQIYSKVKKARPRTLLEEIAKSLGMVPAHMFGDEVWEEFQWAVKYRDFVVHECAFMGLDHGQRLIEASRKVLRRIQKVGHDRGFTKYGRPRNPRLR